MKKLSLLLISSLMLITSCQTSVTPITYNVSNVFNDVNQPVNAFNTAIAITMFNQRDLDRTFPKFEKEIHRLHRLFDSYNYYQIDGQRLNNLKVINDSYGSNQAIAVDQELIDLIKQSIDMMELTEGYFNPTLGVLIDVWSPLFVPFMQEIGTDPSISEVANAKACSATLENIKNIVVVDDNKNTILFNAIPGCNGKAKLALGAIAKGYAMEKAKAIIGDYPYLIDGGRSSLITNGKNPNPARDNWNVVILTPYLGTNLGIAAVNGSATFTTSGDYENSFLVANNDGTYTVRHHILNPFTGYSENHYRSFTILSDKQAGLMDALGTALFNVKDYQKIKSIVNRVSEKYDVKIEILFQQEIKIETTYKLEISLTPGFDSSLLNDTISSLVIKRSILD